MNSFFRISGILLLLMCLVKKNYKFSGIRFIIVYGSLYAKAEA